MGVDGDGDPLTFLWLVRVDKDTVNGVSALSCVTTLSVRGSGLGHGNPHTAK